MGHVDVLKVLLERNANVDIQDNDGNAALMKARLMRQVEAIKVLLEINTNVNATYLWKGVADGRFGWIFDLVKVLLERNANADIKTKDGNTALLTASLMGHAEVVKVLLIVKNSNMDIFRIKRHC